MKKQTKGWIKAAEYDLMLISEIIENEHLTHMIAFHSQQAIEKSIKAILEEKEEKVPRIHDIITLREKIEKYIKLDIDSDIFDQLNELYIDSRYPADLGLLPDGKPSKKTADIFFKTSTKILNDIKNYLTEN